jgi:hypothetical protein
MYRVIMSVEHRMYDYTDNNWRYRNGNRLLKEMKSMPETFNRVITKTDVIGKSRIVRKVLQSEYLSLSGGIHRWFKRSTMKKKSLTRD